MRKVFGGALGLVCLILTVLIPAGVPAPAQQAGMRMEVPVPFLAGNTALPAGSYVVQVDERFRILEVRGQHASARLMLAAKSAQRPAAKAEKGTLAFQRYGDTFVLRNVFGRDDTNGWQLRPTQKEKELARWGTSAEPVLIAESR